MYVGCWVVLNGLCSLCRLISSYLYVRQCVYKSAISARRRADIDVLKPKINC